MSQHEVNLDSSASASAGHVSIAAHRGFEMSGRWPIGAACALVLAAAAVAWSGVVPPVQVGSVALLIVVLAVVWRIAPLFAVRTFGVILPYILLWLAFWKLRGYADHSPFVGATRELAWRFERWAFGGELLNVRLQHWLLDPTHLGVHDMALTVVYASFVLVQLNLAGLICYTRPDRARQYLLGSALILGVGVMLHALLPMNPPWMPPSSVAEAALGSEGHVYRVTMLLAGQSTDYRIPEEVNPLAAMPSIHMAMTTFIVFASGWFGRGYRAVAMIYAVVMAFAIVYLGEHYVIDVVAGVALTAAAWFAAKAILRRVEPRLLSWWRANVRV